MQPVEAAPATHEDAMRSAYGLRALDAHAVGDPPGSAVLEHCQVGVDVEGELLVTEALMPSTGW
jgi:hypothetical protein